MTTTDQNRPLNPADPADAAMIVDHTFGRLRMDGLIGGEVAALMASIRTLLIHTQPKAETEAKP